VLSMAYFSGYPQLVHLILERRPAMMNDQDDESASSMVKLQGVCN
jgi:hypothetical protein